MADFYYAQQEALGHVVEGMRLRFQLRCQIRCLVNVFEAWSREAMVLPPSLVIAHYHCMIAYSSENKLIAGLFERKVCETDAQIQASHFRPAASRMHVPGRWREPI